MKSLLATILMTILVVSAVVMAATYNVGTVSVTSSTNTFSWDIEGVTGVVFSVGSTGDYVKARACDETYQYIFDNTTSTFAVSPWVVAVKTNANCVDMTVVKWMEEKKNIQLFATNATDVTTTIKLLTE